MQIADAHNDLLMNLHTKAEIEKYLNLCKTNEVVKIFTAYYFDEKQTNNKTYNVFDDINKHIELIKDIDIFQLTFENIGFIKNEKDLECLISIKPFCVTLTWNFDNNLAGGAYGSSGITGFGKEVIKTLEANKVIIDTAHLNKKSFLEFSEITKYPIFCSHTSCKSIYHIPRALDDEQLKIINETNGFIGLCLYSSLLSCNRADFEVIYKHLEHIKNLIDFKNIGLGTDFNASGEQNPKGFDIDYNGMQKFLLKLKDKFDKKDVENIANKNLLNYVLRVK